MSIAVITDSTCDFRPEAGIAYRIDIVPLLVNFGGKVYRDGLEISNEEFYTRLAKTTVLPTTSQPPPAVFAELFRRRLDEGGDIVGIFVSSTFSGTFQSAMLARNSFAPEERERIFLADSRHTAGNLGILVLEACKMRDRGLGAEEIRDRVVRLIPRLRLYAMLDTLKYLRMGGRLSAAAAVAGSLLNIAPVITLRDGQALVIAKLRKNQKSFRKWLREKMLSDLPDPQYTAMFLSSNDPAMTLPLQEEFKYLLSPERTVCLSLGAVVATHIGPGACGLCYVARSE